MCSCIDVVIIICLGSQMSSINPNGNRVKWEQKQYETNLCHFVFHFIRFWFVFFFLAGFSIPSKASLMGEILIENKMIIVMQNRHYH